MDRGRHQAAGFLPYPETRMGVRRCFDFLSLSRWRVGWLQARLHEAPISRRCPARLRWSLPKTSPSASWRGPTGSSNGRSLSRSPGDEVLESRPFLDRRVCEIGRGQPGAAGAILGRGRNALTARDGAVRRRRAASLGRRNGNLPGVAGAMGSARRRVGGGTVAGAEANGPRPYDRRSRRRPDARTARGPCPGRCCRVPGSPMAGRKWIPRRRCGAREPRSSLHRQSRFGESQAQLLAP